jgi:hypothetical protein
MVGQSVSLGVEPHLLLFDSYGLVFVVRPLWREGRSVFCTCCWSSPVQSFSGPSPLDLATIFYCLSFETSLFVASYDSQGHSGGIRPRLHMGLVSLSCWSSLHNFQVDWIENTTSNSSPNVVCVFEAVEKCLTSCWIVMGCLCSISLIPILRFLGDMSHYSETSSL